MRKSHVKQKLFDEEADWIPPKGRVFVMKRGLRKEGIAAKQERGEQSPYVKDNDPIVTDAQGMDKAYQQGDGFKVGNRLYVAGSHTARDWFDDVTKIPQWQDVPIPNYLTSIMNSWWGRELLGTGDLRKSERYQRAEEMVKNDPKIDTLIGHSLGGDVVLQLQKDYPERNFKTVTYGAPVWDPFGSDKAKIGQENVTRFSNKGDPVSMFDNSALKTSHPNPTSYMPSLWHDFHNDEQASGRVAGVPITAPKMDNASKTN
jgi:hypothetical protein